jgi:hypothetical protein
MTRRTPPTNRDGSLIARRDFDPRGDVAATTIVLTFLKARYVGRPFERNLAAGVALFEGRGHNTFEPTSPAPRNLSGPSVNARER